MTLQAESNVPQRVGMTLRSYILFGLVMYVAVTAGFLVATSGREKLLAAAIGLALVGPMWMFERRAWVRHYPDGTPAVARRVMSPEISMVITFLGICLTVWDLTRYYQRGDWIRVFLSAFMTLWFLYMMYLAKQRWNRSQKSAKVSM